MTSSGCCYVGQQGKNTIKASEVLRVLAEHLQSHPLNTGRLWGGRVWTEQLKQPAAPNPRVRCVLAGAAEPVSLK